MNIENDGYKGFFRYKLSLNQAMEDLGVTFRAEPFIFFNPNMKPQYRIKRQSNNDGTRIFSWQLLNLAFKPLFDRQSFYKPNGEPTLDEMLKRKYEIGYVKHFWVYCNVKLPVGIYPGQKEVIVIPVRILE